MGAPAYSYEDNKAVGVCSYMEKFGYAYVCVKIRSVFDNFISDKIQRTLPGETCNVAPKSHELSSGDEAEGSNGRHTRQPLCGLPFFNKK